MGKIFIKRVFGIKIQLYGEARFIESRYVYVYRYVHMNRRVAKIDETGFCKVHYKSFMPYNLYLEEEEDIDTLVNNITNFNYWCATRVLTLDRVYAKEILNSIGMTQAVTDKERAKIALSY